MARPSTDVEWSLVRWTETSTRLCVRDRSQSLCELRIPGWCRVNATNMSHRLPRGQGGLWTPANVLDACGSGTTGCHGWIERERLSAYAGGMLVESGQRPSRIAVRLRHPVYGPAWWQPADDGLLYWCGEYDALAPIPYDERPHRALEPA